MRQLSLSVSLLFLSLGAIAAFGQAPPETAANKRVDLAKQELDKVSNLVQDGALPRIRQEQAELDVADAEDDAVLARTLYGEMPVKDVTDKLLEDMVAAAQRRVERQQVRVDLAKKLVADGVTAQSSVTPLEEELSMRRMNLNLAHSRSRLMGELAAMSKYEAAAREIQEVTRIEYRDYFTKGMEHYDGGGTFHASHDLKPLEAAFEKKFYRALPVSANGETETHRSMGFDHAGRVDVALNPGAPEGVWLRRYLKSRGIPYYAFTRAMRGKATAAHIHIGPGSTRLHNAD
jgi:hypothetical protein